MDIEKIFVIFSQKFCNFRKKKCNLHIIIYMIYKAVLVTLQDSSIRGSLTSASSFKISFLFFYSFPSCAPSKLLPAHQILTASRLPLYPSAEASNPKGFSSPSDVYSPFTPLQKHLLHSYLSVWLTSAFPCSRDPCDSGH